MLSVQKTPGKNRRRKTEEVPAVAAEASPPQPTTPPKPVQPPPEPVAEAPATMEPPPPMEELPPWEGDDSEPSDVDVALRVDEPEESHDNPPAHSLDANAGLTDDDEGPVLQQFDDPDAEDAEAA